MLKGVKSKMSQSQSLILVNSTFITERRDPSLNRYPRLDIYKYMLRSISKLNFSHVYFFITLDHEFQNRCAELESYIRQLFINSEIHIEMKRLEHQEEWKPLIEELCKKFPLKQPIFFTQNDDHIFVDENDNLLQQGIQLMSEDSSDFHTLYLSHWPEILKLSGKGGQYRKTGNYVVFPSHVIDSIQIFSLGFLKHILCDIHWNAPYSRIDTISGCSIHNIYVPLKEQCRKFNAYMHVSMPYDYYQQLVLPEENNKEILHMTPEKLKRCVYAPQHSAWENGNNFVVPDEWMQIILELYGLSV
jgi:hypothetical protein